MTASPSGEPVRVANGATDVVVVEPKAPARSTPARNLPVPVIVRPQPEPAPAPVIVRPQPAADSLPAPSPALTLPPAPSPDSVLGLAEGDVWSALEKDFFDRAADIYVMEPVEDFSNLDDDLPANKKGPSGGKKKRH